MMERKSKTHHDDDQIWYRYGYRQLLEGKCADILQPDITWLGGITEVHNDIQMYYRLFYRQGVWLPWLHHMTSL